MSPKSVSILSDRSVKSALRPIKRKLGENHKAVKTLEENLTEVPKGAGDAFLPVVNKSFHMLDIAIKRVRKADDKLRPAIDQLYVVVDHVLMA